MARTPARAEFCSRPVTCAFGLEKQIAESRPVSPAFVAAIILSSVDAGRPIGQAPAMLKIEDISYSVEGRPLLEGASATIPTGHKV